jgi:uncharacterized protein (TIGR00369 family)
VGTGPVVAEPYRGSFFPPELARAGGVELLRSMMERRAPDPPLTRLTDLRVTEVGLDTASMAMPATPWWQSAADGVFLAGALAFVADGPLGSAIMTAAPPGFGMASAGMALDFVRPATTSSAVIMGRARLLHSTRTQGISELSLEDGHGRLLAHGTSRGMILELGRWPEPPPAPAADGTPDPFLRPAVGDVLDQAYWDTHSGMEFARGFVAGEHLPPVCHLTGLAWTACEDGTATCTLPRSPWLCNGFGILYGGAMALLADFAQNSALLTTLPMRTAYAPLDFKVSFLRPVLPDPSVLTAHARVVHAGRTIALTTCELVDDAGRRVALADETMVLLPGRPWSRSLPVGEAALGDGADEG